MPLDRHFVFILVRERHYGATFSTYTLGIDSLEEEGAGSQKA
jgi:hypothetical protein